MGRRDQNPGDLSHRLIIIKRIGSGGFADVYYGKFDGLPVAVKVLHPAHSGECGGGAQVFLQGAFFAWPLAGLSWLPACLLTWLATVVQPRKAGTSRCLSVRRKLWPACNMIILSDVPAWYNYSQASQVTIKPHYDLWMEAGLTPSIIILKKCKPTLS